MDKKYNFKDREESLISKWENNKIYKFHRESSKPLFSIDTPPPTVSGKLHIGHIFSYTQTDIIARYKRMRGYNVFYPFGFDDNGLPTERYVEKKEKISAINLKRSEFIKLCLQESQKAEKLFKALWQQIGLSVDWDYTYSTISENVRKISQESFLRLLEKGYVYKKFEPALYCTTCFTSVAQAELDDIEVKSTFNDIEFILQQPPSPRSSRVTQSVYRGTTDKQGDQVTSDKIIIGTTRPELLPSCVALLYNPKDERYKHLKNQKAIVPIFGHEVPILEDEDVEIEKGTGLVMCCTFGDKNDIQWYKKHKLPYRESIGKNGKWTEITGPLKDLKVVNARTKILELLKEQGYLKNQKEIVHAVNVHERCKREIEYLEISQWFLKILEFKDHFIKEAENINWYPQYMKSRYLNWVENIGWDWCLSRQRFYGIPFPIWYCNDCKEIIVAEIAELPVDPQEQSPKKCKKCSSSNISPDTDVMDTWNTSSLTPFICKSLYESNSASAEITTAKNNFDKNAFIPMSMRPQAHDIIRTWAFYTIVKSWMHLNRIPWKEIVISGHVLAKKEKLSKSKENDTLSPQNLLSQYSADAIRYWTASGSLGQDIAFSETQLKSGSRLVTKLWNAFLFCKEHIEFFSKQELSLPVLSKVEGASSDTSQSLPDSAHECFVGRSGTPENIVGNGPFVVSDFLKKNRIEPLNGCFELNLINQWILSKLEKTFESYDKYFEQNEFGLALQTLDRFFWSDFCDNYLELIKNQLFNPELYQRQDVDSTKWTLFNVGLRILQLYAPYIPFVTEEIYLNVYKKNTDIDSIHLTQLEKINADTSDAEKANIILEIVEKVRKLKTEKQVSLKAEIENLKISCPEEDQKTIKEHEQLIKGVTQAKSISLNSKGSQLIVEV